MVGIKELIGAGHLKPGDVLVWDRGRSHPKGQAVVKQNGMLETPDGKLHSSPTSAAKHFNGGMSINGWRVWKINNGGKSLQGLRSELMAKQIN